MREKVKGVARCFLMLTMSAVVGCGGLGGPPDHGPEISHQMTGPLCESTNKQVIQTQIVLGPDMTLQEMVESLVSQADIESALRAANNKSRCKKEISEFISQFIINYSPVIQKWQLFEEFRRLDATSSSYVADFIARAALLVAEDRLEDVSTTLKEDVKQWKLLIDDVDLETVPQNPFCEGELKYLQDDFVKMPRSDLARGVRVFHCSRPEGVWFYLKDFGWIYPNVSFATKYRVH